MIVLAPPASVATTWHAAAQRPWPGQLEQHGDRQLFVRRAVSPDPSAPVAVFVHGLGGQSMNWTDLMALLQPQVTGVALDLPGFGQSPPPADGYDLSAAAAAVIDLLVDEATTGRGVTLVGNSLGGAVAVRVAARRPDLVERLVAISPALPDLRVRPAIAMVPVVALPRVGTAVFRRLQRVPVEQQVDAMLATNFVNRAALPAGRRDQVVAEYRRRLADPHASDAFSGAARGLVASFLARRASLWHDVDGVVAPTLLVYGGGDRLVDPKRGRQVLGRLSRGELVVLPGVGHLAQVEAPVLTARLLLGFRAATPPTSVAS